MSISATTTTAALPSSTNGAILPPPFPATAGLKRKHAGDLDSATAPQPKARPVKKCRLDKTDYNVKYMAAMCASAYSKRRHENSLPKYPQDFGQAFIRDLEHTFQELESGNIIVHIGEAHSTIPLLARLKSEKTKRDLTKDLVAVYNSVSGLLSVLLQVKKANEKVEKRILDRLHETVSALHHDLDAAVMWHDVLPYTPLSIEGLRWLRGRVKDSREYQPLTGLLASIDNIEQWLSLRPMRCEFSDDIKKIAMAAMQEETEKKVQLASARVLADVHSVDQIIAEKEQKMIDQRQEDVRSTKRAQILAKLQQEKDDQKKNDAAQRGSDLMAVERKQNDDDFKRRTEQPKKQGIAEIKKPVEPNMAWNDTGTRHEEVKLAAEREEQSRQFQQEPEQRKLQDSIKAREAKREELRKRGERNKKAAEALLMPLEHGNMSHEALWSVKLPSKGGCITLLTEIWSMNAPLIISVLPHQLIADEDLLLEFEHAVMVEALSFMLALKSHNGEPNELLSTGWDFDVMNRLQSGLVPYANGSPLSSLKVVVDHVCELLRAARTVLQSANHDSFSSSTSTQESSIFNNSLNTSTGSNTTLSTDQGLQQEIFDIEMADTTKTSLLDRMTKNGQPLAEGTQNNVANYDYADNVDETGELIAASPPIIRNPRTCRFIVNGVCNRGADCDYTHPWDIQSDLPMDTPCYFFFRMGCCKHGEGCVHSHDVARFGLPSTSRAARQLSQNLEVLPSDASAGSSFFVHRRTAGEDDWRSSMPCRDGDRYTKRYCTYMHGQTRDLDNSSPRPPRGPGSGKPERQRGITPARNIEMRPTRNRPSSHQMLGEDRKESPLKSLNPFLSPQPQQRRKSHQHTRVTTQNNGVNSHGHREDANIRLSGIWMTSFAAMHDCKRR
ncbi:hypothetical protein BKA66DRAFT_576661 [Pyrenochaeta sp. MPI-SDFR-AT-0127]|nr:hypothetical protein BKA66DRAFT_576661 [Pyrenochaeta sp. MPI-SDFR-AT-0127]